jgi:hypothetical protein
MGAKQDEMKEKKLNAIKLDEQNGNGGRKWERIWENQIKWNAVEWNVI